MNLENLQGFEPKPAFGYEEELSERETLQDTDSALLDALPDAHVDDWFADLSREIADDNEEHYELADEWLGDDERSMWRKNSRLEGYSAV